MIVFISSPFGNDPEGNTKRARQYCRSAAEKGVVPYAPHLLFPQFMSDQTERKRALHMGLEMLRRCDEVWCFGGISSGMRTEIAEAKRLGIPIRYFIPVRGDWKGGAYEGILR